MSLWAYPGRLFALIGLIGLGVFGAGGGNAAPSRQDADGSCCLRLNTTFKMTGLVSRAPNDPAPDGDGDNASGLSRVRFDLKYAPAAILDAHLAYEQRLWWESGAGGNVRSDFPSADQEIPFRLTSLDRPIGGHGESFFWRHEIDRAMVSLHPAWGEVSIGRQAIGLGRGRVFSAVDMFAPFAATEVDREWRRGVDAARLEYQLTSTASLEGIGVFGPSWSQSAVLVRARGYLGTMDGELILGKRGEDVLAAVVASAAVRGAAGHMEAALFGIPDAQTGGGTFGDDRLVAKAVLGASYTFDIGNGLTLLGEYHYSGFGFAHVGEAAPILAADRTVAMRFLRGDTQTIGRHNLGIQAGYPLDGTVDVGLLVLVSAQDGSGLVSPSVVWDVRPNTTMIASAIAPWGARSAGGLPRSEYGSTPWRLFLQISFYF